MGTMLPKTSRKGCGFTRIGAEEEEEEVAAVGTDCAGFRAVEVVDADAAGCLVVVVDAGCVVVVFGTDF
jgi:hypothetical protein